MRDRMNVRIDSASAVGTSIFAVARRRAVASASSVSVSNHSGDTIVESAAQATSSRSIQPKALAPTVPVARRSSPPATPTISSGTTSGMTVMRTALIHAVPMISSTGMNAVVNADGDVSRESSIPSARPATRPRVT